MTISCLGEGNSVTDFAMDYLNKLSSTTANGKYDITPEESQQDLDDRLVAGLTNLHNRSYWTRLWVVQEFFLCKENIVLCDNRSVHLFRFARTTVLLPAIAEMLENSLARRFVWETWQNGRGVTLDSIIEIWHRQSANIRETWYSGFSVCEWLSRNGMSNPTIGRMRRKYLPTCSGMLIIIQTNPLLHE